jgi:hypothetical protein
LCERATQSETPAKWSGSTKDEGRSDDRPSDFYDVFPCPGGRFPLRVRSDTIGALNLFRNTVGTLSEVDLRAARALAHVATLSILQHRTHSHPQLLGRQLQQALNIRIVIEQAKGVLAERSKVNMEEAFLLLRRYARDHNQRLNQVAQDVTEGELPATALGTPNSPASQPAGD